MISVKNVKFRKNTGHGQSSERISTGCNFSWHQRFSSEGSSVRPVVRTFDVRRGVLSKLSIYTRQRGVHAGIEVNVQQNDETCISRSPRQAFCVCHVRVKGPFEKCDREMQVRTVLGRQNNRERKVGSTPRASRVASLCKSAGAASRFGTFQKHRHNKRAQQYFF